MLLAWLKSTARLSPAAPARRVEGGGVLRTQLIENKKKSGEKRKDKQMFYLLRFPK